jgi:hypothetical protein
MACVKCAGFEEWVLHAGRLLLHSRQRLSNLNWPNMPGAQVADFFHLQEVEKCIAIRSGEQASLLPGSQLPGGNAQNSEKVFSTVSIHV